MDERPESLAGGFLIDADNLEQIEEQIGAAFGAIRINSSTSSSTTRTRVWRSHLGVLSIDDAEYSYDMSYEMEAPDDILLCRVHSGVLEETDARQPPHSHGTGAVVAFGAVAERPIAGRVQKARYHILNVPRVLTQVAGDHPPDGEPVRLTGSTPLSPPTANRYLVDVVDHIRHGLLSNPYAAQEPPLAASGVTRYLASSMLAAFPPTRWAIERGGSAMSTTTTPFAGRRRSSTTMPIRTFRLRTSPTRRASRPACWKRCSAGTGVVQPRSIFSRSVWPASTTTSRRRLPPRARWPTSLTNGGDSGTWRGSASRIAAISG